MLYYKPKNHDQGCQKCMPDKPCRECRKRMYEEGKEKESQDRNS